MRLRNAMGVCGAGSSSSRAITDSSRHGPRRAPALENCATLCAMNPLRFLKAPRFAGDLSRRQFFLIIGLFWLYVTLSNVLYAYGMQTGIAHMTDVPLFAPWNARVLQHLLLLPFLVVSYWASLRIRWRPLLAAIPLQLVLGLFFAALAYPAMVLAEMAVGDKELHHVALSHMADADPLWSALWL